MLRGIETTKRGMMSVLELNDNIANNLANVNTTGFKQTQVVFKNIHDSMIRKVERSDDIDIKIKEPGKLSMGSQLDSVVIDFSQGGIKQTGNPFDMAVNGNGFFKVEMPDGSEAYTRNGSFKLHTDGTVTTVDNKPVLGKDGPIELRINNKQAAEINISKDGTISFGKQVLGKVELVDFEDKVNMRALGNSLYVPTNPDINQPIEAKNFSIQQGALETSNANVITSLVNSVSASRAYESMNNVMQTNMKTLQQTINQVGKVKR